MTRDVDETSTVREQLEQLRDAVSELQTRVAELEAGKKDKHHLDLPDLSVPRAHPGGSGPAV